MTGGGIESESKDVCGMKILLFTIYFANSGGELLFSQQSNASCIFGRPKL